MRRTAIAILTLASLALTACGPDEHESFNSTQAAADQPLPASAVEPLIQKTGEQAASNAVASAQASLAADAQQITPVLHSPPDSTQ
jgi:hypothetical protein